MRYIVQFQNLELYCQICLYIQEKFYSLNIWNVYYYKQDFDDFILIFNYFSYLFKLIFLFYKTMIRLIKIFNSI